MTTDNTVGRLGDTFSLHSAVRTFDRYRAFANLADTYDLTDFDSAIAGNFLRCLKAGIIPGVAVALVGSQASLKEVMRASAGENHIHVEHECIDVAVNWLQEENDTLDQITAKEIFSKALEISCSLGE